VTHFIAGKLTDLFQSIDRAGTYKNITTSNIDHSKKMNKITLAIPFYNTSQYFSDCVMHALENKLISEIVINDDFSDQKHYEVLLSIIKEYKTEKIKLFRNKRNEGALRNKYLTVKKCSNEWVYLLDSDNRPFEESYRILQEIPKYDTDVCYCPEKLFCGHDPSGEYEVIANYDFGYDVIDIQKAKLALQENLKWFDWFINTGNYIFNKTTYLTLLRRLYENDNIAHPQADTAAVFYYWLKGGGKFKIIKNLGYFHRLRPDSNWNAFGDKSQLSVDYYKSAIIALQSSQGDLA
jgi:glycosyltransferase involved in cell wall biosynthesis